MQRLKKYFKPALPFLLALITLVILLVFKHNPEFTEQVYSQSIYPVIARILSFFSNWVPFSLDDLFYGGLILFLVVGILLVVLKKVSLGKYIFRLLQVLALVFCMFYWFWGFNYFRTEASQRIFIKKGTVNSSSFHQVFSELIQQTNSSYTPIQWYNKEECDLSIEKSFEGLADFLQISYPGGTRRVKHITFSDFFAKATILGYYGPFFNEVHVNKHLTVLDVPIVGAHEKAHQFGITSEAEASFYGWLVCVNSDRPFVNYSGWLYALDYFLFESRNMEDRGKFIEMIRPEVIADLRYRHEYWMQWRNEKIDRAASKVNDAYLKSNGVEKGVDDYNDVVKLIVDYHQISKSF